MNLGTYFHTVRHLKYRQIVYRLGSPFTPAPRFGGQPPDLRSITGTWTAPADRKPAMLGPGLFRFLNEERPFSGGRLLGDPPPSRLWRYNFHYFDDLAAPSAAERVDWHRKWLADWLSAYGQGGEDAWDPYPASRRIVNWIKYQLAGHELPTPAVGSLADQARHLRRTVEWHLLANHLFANAKALIFAGCFFDGNEAQAWRTAGLRILDSEIQEQILADGGHFERTPMYHSTVLEDVLDLLNLAQTFPGLIDWDRVGQWRGVAQRMVTWINTMQHPDREIAFFHDSALGIAPCPAALAGYAARLSVAPAGELRPLQWLKPSGYVRMQAGGAVVLFDVGDTGPAYQPGHAHAEALSFEFSYDGRRIFVNSGISTYDPGAERARQRGSAAHNTVVVDSRDQSEVWSAFRVGRRARVSGVNAGESNGCLTAEGKHDGYARLSSPVTHHRRITLQPGVLVVEDRLAGEGRHTADVMFHLHPAVRVSATERAGSFDLECSGTRARVVIEGDVTCGIEPSAYYPEFGVTQPSSLIRARFEGNMPASVRTIFTAAGNTEPCA